MTIWHYVYRYDPKRGTANQSYRWFGRQEIVHVTSQKTMPPRPTYVEHDGRRFAVSEWDLQQHVAVLEELEERG